MKRIPIVAALLLVLCLPSFGSQLQKELKGRWLGAWVVTTAESYSDCGGNYTNNRIHGNLVKSGGAYSFRSGELAKVDKIDVKRSRFDVLLTLNEPILVPYQEGPFTLYREVWCKLELEVALPRHVVKNKDAEFIDRSVLAVLERHSRQDDAEMSAAWNRRERDPYPEGYEHTLAELQVWRAEQANLQVQARLDFAAEETDRLVHRVTGDPVYLEGFADGIEAARGNTLHGCPALLSVRLGRTQTRPAETVEEQTAHRRQQGFEDGKTLVYGLEMLRRLPGCFVPVPEVEEVQVAFRDD